MTPGFRTERTYLLFFSASYPGFDLIQCSERDTVGEIGTEVQTIPEGWPPSPHLPDAMSTQYYAKIVDIAASTSPFFIWISYCQALDRGTLWVGPLHKQRRSFGRCPGGWMDEVSALNRQLNSAYS